MSVARQWLLRRRELLHAWRRVRAVELECRDLIEELERRRDGFRPGPLALPELRRALDEVDPR